MAREILQCTLLPSIQVLLLDPISAALTWVLISPHLGFLDSSLTSLTASNPCCCWEIF